MSVDKDLYLYSNEGEIYRFFPHVQPFQGTIVGVGSDQVLDIYANSNLQGAVFADRSEVNCAQLQVVLETASILTEDLGVFPTPEQFIASFQRDKFRAFEPHLERRMGRVKMLRGRSLVTSWLPYQIEGESRSLNYSDYMAERAKLTADNGESYAWYSTPEKLARVVDGYINDRILIQTADFMNSDDTQDLADSMADLPTVDVLYLSNVEQNLEHEPNSDQYGDILWANLHQLPLGRDGVILRTAMERLPLELRIQDPKVAEHPIFRKIFLRWHYNVESFANHQSMIFKDPTYTRMGWLSAVLGHYLTSDGRGYRVGLSQLPPEKLDSKLLGPRKLN